MAAATPTDGASLLQSGVVAALVAAVVSITTLLAGGRRARLDRQRQVFADAFEACAAYREFAFIVRRRADDSAEERARITGLLSDVQHRLASLEARVLVEAPRVGVAFSRLVADTRAVAGSLIKSGWDSPPLPADRTGRIEDVDFTPLDAPQAEYLDAVRDHLGHGPAWLRSAGRRTWRRVDSQRD